VVTRYLNWLPGGRIDITLNDQTDGANGFASSLPHNFIFGYGVPPAALDELNDFDDFLKLLITHELTHVVHLDTILGAARGFNFILGKVFAPNLAQPNWWIEGLAVLMESRYTTAGRLRSSLFDMHLRVPILEGRLHDLAAISNVPLAFPYGTVPYLYGSSLLQYIEDRFGPDKVAEMSHRYGGTLIPGGFNRVAWRSVGERYLQIWEAWKAALERKYSLQSEEARRRGLTQTTRLTHEGFPSTSHGLAPRWFRNGRGLLFHSASPVAAPAYVLLDPATGRREKLAELYSVGVASPTPDGRTLVFQQTNFQALPRRISGSPHVDWDDLFRLNLENGEVSQLTHARRAHEPDVSPDGRQIACTVGAIGTFDLAVVPIEGGEPKILPVDGPGIAYSPSWSPDGRQIVYSRWKPGGYRDIHIYDLPSGKDRPLFVDRAMDIDPRFTSDSRFIIFSSDRTGIYNVYAHELSTARLFQVTNLLHGAFQPALSPDGKLLVFTGFTSAGFDLFSTPFDPAALAAAEPYVTAREDAPAIPPTPAEAVAASKGTADEPPSLERRVTPYQPWKYMYPRRWTVGVPSNPLGLGTSLQIETGVSDPVGNHGVRLAAVVPGDGDASLRGDYSYVGLWPSFGFTVTRAAAMAQDLIIDDQIRPYRQHTRSVSAQVGLPILRKTDGYADLSFGYRYHDYRPAETLPVADPSGGITIPPETGPNADLFLGWYYDNARAWTYSISGQEGRRLQLNLLFSDRAIGSRFQTTEVNWSWTEYLTPPWGKLHALALVYSGGVGIGDKRSVFAIGGFAQQDLVRSVFLNRRQCCLFLRGYSPGAFVGDQYHIVSAEYRAPFLSFEKGHDTFFVYLRRLHGALVADAGNAFFGDLRLGDLKYGVGAELRFEFTLFYYLPSELQLGVAKGLSTGGVLDYYFVTAFNF
jgi:Tol biopolymer transport system component